MGTGCSLVDQVDCTGASLHGKSGILLQNSMQRIFSSCFVWHLNSNLRVCFYLDPMHPFWERVVIPQSYASKLLHIPILPLNEKPRFFSHLAGLLGEGTKREALEPSVHKSLRGSSNSFSAYLRVDSIWFGSSPH